MDENVYRLVQGLRRYGLNEIAGELAAKSAALFLHRGGRAPVEGARAAVDLPAGRHTLRAKTTAG